MAEPLGLAESPSARPASPDPPKTKGFWNRQDAKAPRRLRFGPSARPAPFQKAVDRGDRGPYVHARRSPEPFDPSCDQKFWSPEPIDPSRDQKFWSPEPIDPSLDRKFWSSEPVDPSCDQKFWSPEPIDPSRDQKFRSSEPADPSCDRKFRSLEPFTRLHDRAVRAPRSSRRSRD